MLNLFDFSAVLQVVIAFYGVYAVKCRDIGDTLIFHIIQEPMKKVLDVSVKNHEEAKKGYAKLETDLSRIDQEKLTEAQKNLMSTDERGAKQEVEIAADLRERLDLLCREYVGQSYFPIIAIDIVLLSFAMLVFGVLDHKLIWNADDICMINICFVAVLVIHCLVYEFSSRVRSVSKFEPGIISHVVLMTILGATSIALMENSKMLEIIRCDIRLYMIIYGCIVLLPPVVVVVRNLRMINGLRKLMEESMENRKFAMQWFYRDVKNYKEMYEMEG